MPGTTKFASGSIREAADDNRPARTGAWWIEGTKSRRSVVPAGWVMLALGLGLVAWGFLQMGEHGPFALAWWLYASPLLLAGLVMLLSGTTPRRELAFIGGRTLTPLGTHADRALDWPDLPLERIAKFELGKGDLGVFALDTDGGYRLIADRLTEAESRTVAAELTSALAAARR